MKKYFTFLIIGALKSPGVREDRIQEEIDQKQEMKDQIQEMKDQIQEMKDQKQEMKDQIQKMKDRIQEEIDQIQKMKDQIQEEIDQIQKMKDQIQEEIDQIQEMKDQKQEKIDQIQKIIDQIQELASIAQKVQKELASIAQKKVQKELATLRSTNFEASIPSTTDDPQTFFNEMAEQIDPRYKYWIQELVYEFKNQSIMKLFENMNHPAIKQHDNSLYRKIPKWDALLWHNLNLWFTSSAFRLKPFSPETPQSESKTLELISTNIWLQISEHFYCKSFISLDKLEVSYITEKDYNTRNGLVLIQVEGEKCELKKKNGEMFSILKNGKPTYLYITKYGGIIPLRLSL